MFGRCVCCTVSDGRGVQADADFTDVLPLDMSEQVEEVAHLGSQWDTRLVRMPLPVTEPGTVAAASSSSSSAAPSGCAAAPQPPPPPSASASSSSWQR